MMDGLVARFRGGSLNARFMRSSVFTLGGYGLGQALRLLSNLLLTRLLFPEAFGMMALVAVIMQGLAMFSDVGVSPAIMRSSRGDDQRFLDTAWTIQVIRGGVLWLFACLIAIPVSNTSVNPARSLGVAWFAGGDHLAQVWVFILAPLVGAAIAGISYAVLTGDEDETPAEEEARVGAEG